MRLYAPAIGLLLAGCSSTDGNSSNSGSTGSGTSGGLQCDTACQDGQVAYAVDSTAWLLWNQDIAGMPSGNIDRMAPCPLGGTTHITGTTSVASNQVNTADINFDLSGCANSGPSFSLTFIGALKMHGTFGGNYANAVTFSSASLSTAGTIKEYDQPQVNETCPVSVTDTYNAMQTNQIWLNGTVCGRSVSE